MLEPNVALANTNFPDRLVVLLIDENGKSFYDDQTIVISEDQCVRQIGIYKYETKVDKHLKTVPAVVVE